MRRARSLAPGAGVNRPDSDAAGEGAGAESVTRGSRAHLAEGDAGAKGLARDAPAQCLLMLPAILKIGRYIETTRPPTTMPRNAIMIGSMSEVIAPTAWSTSSS